MTRSLLLALYSILINYIFVVAGMLCDSINHAGICTRPVYKMKEVQHSDSRHEKSLH
jgi:hypothetical protein